MFGTKLRTWMEAHIVRSKKKKDRKKGEKGFDSNRDSPRSHGSNRSPALYQVHPVDRATKSVDGIRLPGEDGRCGTVSASSATSSATSAGTGSVSLSSPESAYSTGYSTDGTSPGTSYPPEYYINIRTGTHYFQSNSNVNTGSSNNNHNNNNNNCSNNNNNNNNNHRNENGNRSKRPFGASKSPVAGLLSGRRHGRFDDNVDRTASARATVFASRNANMDHGPSNGFRTSAQSKIAERSANHDGTRSQRTRPQTHRERCHRQTESFSADSSRSNLAAPPPLLSPTTQSPRERSRIRTNPWLSSTNSSGSGTLGFKYRANLDDTGSGSGLRLADSSGSASDVNASSAREERTRREFKQESLSAGRSPINQNWRIASGMEIRPKIALPVQRRNSSSSNGSSSRSSSSSSSNSSDNDSGSTGSGSNGSGVNENGNEKGNDGSSGTSIARSARSSEDDVTLNEMMGKFDESYVYEKETDILSDSDPTDCEDYVESVSDVDAVRDAGDENETLDNDDLDYIDNGSFLDLDLDLDLDDLDRAARFPNTGHCTYFAFTGELARRTGRLRESLTRRRNRDDIATLHRTIGAKGTTRKQPARHKRSTDELLPGDKRKKKSSQRRKSNVDKRDQGAGVVAGARAGAVLVDYDDEEAANLNRVLVERMLLKNSGFNQGSRSVGGTPICMRRKKHDVNENLPPMRSRDDRPSTVRIDPEIVDKRRSNSVSYVNGNSARRRLATTGNAFMSTFASEIALIEADKEADKKYRELILEAENILANMQKNHSVPIVPSPSRTFHYGLANKRVELIKNTELNIELALSKSRNSQPELQSGSIRDLEHTSPKRQQVVQPSPFLPRFPSNRASPLVSKRVPPPPMPLPLPLPLPLPQDRRSSDGEPFPCPRPEVYETWRDGIAPSRAAFPSRDSPGVLGSLESNRNPTSLAAKEEGLTSSSSDSEERCDGRRRPPLLTFRSIDMGPVKEGSSYCPQSEPVKRKVYAGSATYGRIRKTLGGEQAPLRNSDGDTATDPDTDDSRRSLKEKVARLRRERLAASPSGTLRRSQIFQQQLSQLRRQMLVQTIQGLKQSLENQSATLKQSCLEPMMAERLP